MALKWIINLSNKIDKTSKLEDLRKYAKKLLQDLIEQYERNKELKRANKQLEKENKKIEKENKELKKKLKNQAEAKINIRANQPSSKKPEWDKEGNPKKSKKKKNKRSKREGSGNKKKPEIQADQINHNILCVCPFCGDDLKDQKVLEQTDRIVEDIVSEPNSTIVYKEEQERKWCPKCKKLVSSTSTRALPGSDYGLNTVVLMSYLWIVSSLSLPSIQKYLNSFMKLSLSTSGISKLMIRLSEIFQPVYNEIKNDVKIGVQVWADETGWRIKGKLHWLWIFSNNHSSFYWIDKSRGSPVVEKILGTIFYGILITDAWYAYAKIDCDKQTCMSHIFRKIRFSFSKEIENIKKSIKRFTIMEKSQSNFKKVNKKSKTSRSVYFDIYKL